MCKVAAVPPHHLGAEAAAAHKEVLGQELSLVEVVVAEGRLQPVALAPEAKSIFGTERHHEKFRTH